MIGRCMRDDPWNPDKVPMVLLPVHDPQVSGCAGRLGQVAVIAWIEAL